MCSEVGLDDGCAATEGEDLISRLFGGVSATSVVDDEVSTGLSEADCNSRTDAARRAGDKGSAAN
jgi:hypothetical protein